MQLDVRVVDIATNASFMDADFRAGASRSRSTSNPARGNIKVFLSSTAVRLRSASLLDTTYSFTEEQPYFFYLSGRARAGGTRATITTLAPPTPPAGTIRDPLPESGAVDGRLGARDPRHRGRPDIFITGGTDGRREHRAIAGSPTGPCRRMVFVDTGCVSGRASGRPEVPIRRSCRR